MRKLPGHCSYCGKRYKGCYSDTVSLFHPFPQTGKCCPDGHEGYVVEGCITGDSFKFKFDFVKDDKDNG